MRSQAIAEGWRAVLRELPRLVASPAAREVMGRDIRRILDAGPRQLYALSREPNDAWLVGPAGAAGIFKPSRPMRGLEIARRVFAGERVAIETSIDADRNAVRLAAFWVEHTCKCPPLSDAMVDIAVTPAGARWRDRGLIAVNTWAPGSLAYVSPMPALRSADGAPRCAPSNLLGLPP